MHNGIAQCAGFLVFDGESGMPPVRSVEHMPYHVFLLEHQVTFDVLILPHGDFDRRRRLMAGSGPCATFTASVYEIGDQGYDRLWYASCAEYALHLHSGGTPPPQVQFADFAALLGFSAGPKHS